MRWKARHPVSALIHAATMVTAGVFMVARLSPVFEYAPTALMVVTAIGTMTAVFAATVGLVQNDIKRVIAYSTCSQLGYMFVACGVGAYSVAIFHLFTHAFFKALLFLGAGSVIHAMHHEQDMRNMGGLAPKIRTTWIMMLIGTLALTGVGIPHLGGFAGFHSKDAIIEAAYAAHTPYNYAFWALVVRSLHDVVLFVAPDVHDVPRQDARGTGHVFKHAHESPTRDANSAVRAWRLGAVVAGFAFTEYFIGHDYKEFWKRALLQSPEKDILHHMHEAVKKAEWIAWSPFIAMLSGLGLAWLYYVSRCHRCRRRPPVPSGRSICSSSTSGTSTSFMTGCL